MRSIRNCNCSCEPFAKARLALARAERSWSYRGMKTWHLLIALQVTAAAIGLFDLASFYGSHILDAAVPEETRAVQRTAFALILLLTFCVIGVLLWKRADASLALLAAAVTAMVVTAVAGYVPRLVDAHVRQQTALEQRAGFRRDEQEFLAEFAQRKQALESRLHDHRPFTPDDALEFLMFLRNGDFRNFGLSDHTPAGLNLLRQALEAKLVDPNGPVAGEQYFGRASSAAEVDAVAERLAAAERQAHPNIYEINGLKTQFQMISHQHRQFEALRGKPLFLFYYETVDLGGSVKYQFERGMTHEWAIMELLVEYGADLSRSDAAPLVADLATWKSRTAQKGAEAQ
jgi:hypothetical protein